MDSQEPERRRDFFIDAIAEAVAERLEHMQGQRKRLLTMEDAAEYLGMSPDAIYHLVSDGKLKPVRFDRRLRFDVRDLDRLIEDGKQVK
jgi:excisionase family DNA binding protein